MQVEVHYGPGNPSSVAHRDRLTKSWLSILAFPIDLEPTLVDESPSGLKVSHLPNRQNEPNSLG